MGKEITEQEAQDSFSGKTAIPDEELAGVSGGCRTGEYYRLLESFDEAN